MKRFLLHLLLLTVYILPTRGQEGLHIDSLFSTQHPYKQSSREVWVEGSRLKTYNLSLYRSYVMESLPEETDFVESLIEADSKHAYSKETGRVGNRLYYAFLCLPPAQGQTNRYIFYRNASLRKNGKRELTLVYMEGQVSFEQLKEIFKK